MFVTPAWWSWRKWPDPLIDFGRELYLPWQITRGGVLYRDLASLFGPLSPYVNAIWFKLFGSSLMPLVICNLAIFALCRNGEDEPCKPRLRVSSEWHRRRRRLRCCQKG